MTSERETGTSGFAMCSLRLKRAAGALGGAFLMLALCSPPHATIIGRNTYQDGSLYPFDERQNVVLTMALTVDDLADGSGGGLGAGFLPVGTEVSSHYVFFDPETSVTQSVGRSNGHLPRRRCR